MKHTIPVHKEIVLRDEGNRVLTVKTYSTKLIVFSPGKGKVEYKPTGDILDGREVWSIDNV